MKVFSASLRALLLGCALVAGSAQAQKVLKFIPQADLRILDPIATTAYITRNHGYMIYDTLLGIFAMAEAEGIPTYKAADRLAEKRLEDV